VKTGWPGASILIILKGDRKIWEFLSNSDGSFTIPLEGGIYDVEFIAEGSVGLT
jgi:hypothetical protein